MEPTGVNGMPSEASSRIGKTMIELKVMTGIREIQKITGRMSADTIARDNYTQ
jgi:hypothetical protein